MSGRTINEILAKIDQRLDEVRLSDYSEPLQSLDPLSEVGLYISSDRLLADLYRQYLEAQRHYITSIQTHGTNAPMTEIASDMSDSAYCAVETRLIELREEKEISERVLRMQLRQRNAYHAKTKQNIKHDGDNQNIAFWTLLAFSVLQQKENIPTCGRPATFDFTHAAA